MLSKTIRNNDVGKSMKHCIVINKTTDRKHLRQAILLGRVERLSGNRIGSNPYPKGSDLWIAFNEGWNRLIDDPLTESTQKSKQTP